MATDKQVRHVARAICRVVASDVGCIMDEHPDRELCDDTNCRMIGIAKDAIARAEREGPAGAKKNPSIPAGV